MRTIFFALCFWGLTLGIIAQNKDSSLKIKIHTPEYVIGQKSIRITIQALTPKTQKIDINYQTKTTLWLNEKKHTVNFQNGTAELPINIDQTTTFTLKANQNEGKAHSFTIRYIPAWLGILPPLIAIIMALLLKEVVISLFTGIFLGAFILKGFSFEGFFSALLTVADTYILNALNDPDHIAVIIFTASIGGLVAIISKNGGMTAIVDSLSSFANTARNTQLVTWALGILIFFDDYANTLIIGNTMRPMTDKFKISREKLAYIVDSTSAPVAAIAFTTTWIGAELGYIKDAAQQIGLKEGAYSIFLSSLEYAYYPIFALLFMLFLLVMQRDFGAMYKAELRARTTGKLNETNVKEGENQGEVQDVFKEFEPLANVPKRSINALLPVLLVVGGTIVGLFYTGWQGSALQMLEAGASETQIQALWQNLQLLNEGQEPSFTRKIGILLGNANSYTALIWASLLALLLAILMTATQRIMALPQIMETMLVGFKAMLSAILILSLAWALAKVNEDLETATFITSLLSQGISPYLLATITFIFAALIAFSTGSSWGTMAILYPLILPATWTACQHAGFDTETSMAIFYQVTAMVLSGAVFGDHCSPISDTTILSSMASGSDHIAHVRTQLPYALIVGFVSIFTSLVLNNIGLPWYLTFLIGIGILWVVARFFGKKIPEASDI